MVWVVQSGSEFVGYSPDQLVEYQRAASNSDVYTILDRLIIPYLQGKEGTHGYLSLIMGTIRSFFLHNRATLPRDTVYKIKPTRPPVRGDLSLEDIRSLILSSKPVYQAIFTSMFMGGMDQSTFVYWNENGWEDLENKLRKVKNTDEIWIHKIRVPGRKAGRNIKDFYTFIGRDALKVISEYVGHERPQGARAIFVNNHGDPISKNAIYQYWNRHMRKIGLVSREKGKDNRTGKNPHELRDVFRSRWRLSGVDVEIAEFLLGHDIDKLGYDKSPHYFPDWFEEQYELAMPYLNIMTEDPEKIPRKQIRKEQTTMTRRIEELEEQLRQLREEMIPLIEEKIAVRQELLKKT
jgi:hypothetical protein